MAVRDISTKSARLLLEPRREPYWSRLRAGLYVGFRRLKAGEGTWIARRRADDGLGQQHRALGDLAHVPDVRSQRFDEARLLTEQWAIDVDQGATHRRTTLEAACRSYVEDLSARKSQASAVDANGRFTRLLYGTAFGRKTLDKLLTRHVRGWLTAQVDNEGDDDDKRRSQDTANRNLRSLRAALSFALKERLVATDAAWKTVTPFKKVGRRREQELSTEQREALLKHCPEDLALFVRALLYTAARPGEIAHANAGDFDKNRGALALSGKTGARVVALSSEAAAFFAEQTRNKLPNAPLLVDAWGNRWGKDAWKVRFKDAVRAAGLPDGVVLYSLRHAVITDMVVGGVDAFTTARLAGTSVEMIHDHYMHLRDDLTRAALDNVEKNLIAMRKGPT